MQNFFAVLLIAAAAIASLTLVGEDDATASTGIEAQVADVTLPATALWEYRVLSARVNPIARQAGAESGVQFVGLRSSASTSASNGADPLASLERELNRLGGEGWEMCSAAADGTMVFRRVK